MTAATETGLKERVLQYIGDPAKLSLDSIAGVPERLREVAKVFGLDVGRENFGRALEVIGEAAQALEAVANRPSPGANPDALRKHISEQEAALLKLEALEGLLNSQSKASVLEQFKFKREGDLVEFVIPKGMSLIQAFTLLNTEAERLGINPAVWAADFDWYRENAGADETRAEDLKVVLRPVAEGSIGMSRAKMEKAFQMQDMGQMALANALEWVASGGKTNSFVNDRGEEIWVRGNVPGFALRRFGFGVGAAGLDDNALGFVGCSSGPN